MKKKVFLFFMGLVGTVFGMDRSGSIEPAIRSIDDVPTYYAKLVKKLLDQPTIKIARRGFFGGRRVVKKNYKVLFLGCDNEENSIGREGGTNAAICDLLSKYSEKFLKGKTWNIFLAKAEDPSFSGLGIFLEIKKGFKKYSFEELKDAYTNVIDELKKGWKMVFLEDKRVAFFKRAKNGTMRNLEEMIFSVGCKLGLCRNGEWDDEKRKIACVEREKGDSTEYLIKMEEQYLKEVCSKLGFRDDRPSRLFKFPSATKKIFGSSSVKVMVRENVV